MVYIRPPMWPCALRRGTTNVLKPACHDGLGLASHNASETTSFGHSLQDKLFTILLENALLHVILMLKDG